MRRRRSRRAFGRLIQGTLNLIDNSYLPSSVAGRASLRRWAWAGLALGLGGLIWIIHFLVTDEARTLEEHWVRAAVFLFGVPLSVVWAFFCYFVAGHAGQSGYDDDWRKIKAPSPEPSSTVDANDPA